MPRAEGGDDLPMPEVLLQTGASCPAPGEDPRAASPAASCQVFLQAPTCLPGRLLCRSVIREQLRLRLGVQSKGVCRGQGLCTPRTGLRGGYLMGQLGTLNRAPSQWRESRREGVLGSWPLQQHAPPAKDTSGWVCDILCAGAGRPATLGSRQQGGRVASLTPALLAASPRSYLFILWASVALFIKWRQQCSPSGTTVRPHATMQGTWLRGHGSHWLFLVFAGIARHWYPLGPPGGLLTLV